MTGTAPLRKAGCEKIYSEHISTRSDRRPVLDEAFAYLRPGDTLVVWKLDRLARSLSQLIQTIDRLGRSEILFHTLTERLDTTTPAGRAVFHVTGAFSEFERSIIRERTLASLQAARDAGKTVHSMNLPEPCLNCALFLDFDGTIVDIAPTPGSVDIPDCLPSLLVALRYALGNAVAIVTGRPIEQIDGFLGGGRSSVQIRT